MVIVITYTLEDLNSHAFGVLFISSRVTLPINELKRSPTFGGCADLNLHRCKMIVHSYILKN